MRVMTTAQERKKQERYARRLRIQQAARDIFATKGYAKTSIEQVAQAASLSVGAIYLYFRSKEDLYTSLLEAPLATLADELGEIAAQSGAGDLPAAWSRMIEWAHAHAENTLMLRSISHPDMRKRLSDEVARGLGDRLDRIRDTLRAVVTRGIDANVYRPVDAVATADLVWSLFVGLLQSTDTRDHLALTGTPLADLAPVALTTLEASLRVPQARVAEAA